MKHTSALKDCSYTYRPASNQTPTAAGPYSQAIKAASQIWVSGQIPADEKGNLIGGTIAEKTRKCCENIKNTLEAGGSEITKVVRVGVSTPSSFPTCILLIFYHDESRPQFFLDGVIVWI